MRFIKSSREYHEVYSRHHKRHGSLFLFLIKKSHQSEEKSVGIVVSRKVGNAVRRNKVKRRVRAYLREHIEELPSGKLVIIARAGAGVSDWQHISEDLKRNLKALSE